MEIYILVILYIRYIIVTWDERLMIEKNYPPFKYDEDKNPK